MKALTFGGRETVHLETVPDPSIEAATDVIVEVRLTSICGSDLHVYHERERGLDHGTTLGHEFVGEILDVGREVTTLKPGDLVASPFTTSCGDCFYCRGGLTSRCREGRLFGWVSEGKGLQGVQSEYVRVPLADSTLLALPEDVDLEGALLLGDVLATGYFAADSAELRSGVAVAVVGCGPVGLMAIVGARDFGVECMFAIDGVTERLQLAESFGATALHLDDQELVLRVREATESRGVDAVLEAVGSPSALGLAVELARPGGIVSSVGVHNSEAFGFRPIDIYDKNLTIKNGRCPARHYMNRLLPWIRDGRYPLVSIISHRLPLHKGARGYDIFARRLEGCTKVVLAP